MLKKKAFKNRIVITFGVISAFIGLILLSNNYLESKVIKVYDDMNLQILALNDNENILNNLEQNEEELSNEQINNLQINTQSSQSNEEAKKEDNKPKIKYVGSLSIPKISFEHGLTDMNSKYNDVKYGVEIVNGSNYPNVLNGNFILASHSGNSSVSFFKNLYKLTIGDTCVVKYKGKTYEYKIVNIYNKPKIGKITIDRNYNKNTLTLITCTKDSKTEQTIYIGELI